MSPSVLTISLTVILPLGSSAVIGFPLEYRYGSAVLSTCGSLLVKRKSSLHLAKWYGEDLGHPAPSSGDLTPWTERGVLLLNRVLTVQPGQPAAHRGKGWEEITDQAIRALAARPIPLVAILWGRDARTLRPALGAEVPCIESAHPSPMSADRGFFGSRPFSRVNELLEGRGADPIDWKLP